MDIWNYQPSPDFMAFIGVIVIFVLIFLLAGFVLWIFQCIALYTLAKNRGMGGAGLAWIPIIGRYRIGSVADDISMAEGSKSVYGMFILIGTIVSYTLSSVSTSMLWPSMANLTSSAYYGDFGSAFAVSSALSSFGGILGLALYVIQIIALNKIYKCYRPESATAWTVLSAIPFTAFLAPIFLFIIRNHEPKMHRAMPGAPGGYHQGYPPNGYAPGGYAPPPQGYPHYPHQPYYPQPPQCPQPPYQQAQPPPVYQPPEAPQPPLPDTPQENNDDDNLS